MKQMMCMHTECAQSNQLVLFMDKQICLSMIGNESDDICKCIHCFPIHNGCLWGGEGLHFNLISVNTPFGWMDT